MNLPFWLNPQRRVRVRVPAFIPAPRPAARMLWWTQLLTGGVVLGATAAVFTLTGGNPHRLVEHRAGGTYLTGPFAAALIVFAALIAVMWLVEHEARHTERQHANDWYAQQHPERVGFSPELTTQYVQQILREQGPMHMDGIRSALAAGGPWGPPTFAGAYVLDTYVLFPAGYRASWLTPSRPGDPYSHIDRPYQPAGQEVR